MKSKISFISNLVSWMVAIFIVVVAGMLALSKFNTPLKLRVFAVLSGSMEPALNVGSLVIVKDQAEYKIGDIITAVPVIGSNKTYTHRITGIVNREDRVLYQTKGDANEEADPELAEQKRVIGKVIFHIPYLGKIVMFSQTQMGFVLLIVIPATLLAYNEFNTIKKEIARIFRARKSAKKLATESLSNEDKE
ncbi:MAG: signal peptidase I [Patescibacteria group bacterium]